MAEHVRIESITRGEGKVTITLELDINEFWEDQLARNKELRVAKRPLLAALEHDATHGPYVSLLPVFAKMNIENLESQLEEQFRKHNPPQAMVLNVPGMSRFIEDNGIVVEPGIDPARVFKHHGPECLPIMKVQRIPSLEEFCKGRGIEISEVKVNDVGEGDGVI